MVLRDKKLEISFQTWARNFLWSLLSSSVGSLVSFAISIRVAQETQSKFRQRETNKKSASLESLSLYLPGQVFYLAFPRMQRSVVHSLRYWRFLCSPAYDSLIVNMKLF